MKGPGATWWRSLNCASVITRDAEVGDRDLSLAPHVSRLKHQSPYQLRFVPGVASSTGPPNIVAASLTARSGSFSAQRWDSTRAFAPAARASAPASAGVMCPRDANGSWEPPEPVPSAMMTCEPEAGAARVAAGPRSAGEKRAPPGPFDMRVAQQGT